MNSGETCGDGCPMSQQNKSGHLQGGSISSSVEQASTSPPSNPGSRLNSKRADRLTLLIQCTENKGEGTEARRGGREEVERREVGCIYAYSLIGKRWQTTCVLH